jgi:hypothetical protein
LKKLLQLLKKIPPDKLIHLLGGYFIASLFPGDVGLLVAILTGIGKEVYDYKTKTGTPEWRDAACTIAGGVLYCAKVALWSLL